MLSQQYQTGLFKVGNLRNQSTFRWPNLALILNKHEKRNGEAKYEECEDQNETHESFDYRIEHQNIDSKFWQFLNKKK